MSGPARIDSIDILKHFRTALWKFAEAATVALGDAEADMQRTLNWLETEQTTFWQGQIRKRSEIVSRCKEAVRQKKLFKDAAGRTPAAVEEEKALAIATRRLADAEQKLASVKRYARVLHKEIQLYKGGVQRFATAVQLDVPVAVSRLDQMAAALEAYVSLTPASAGAAEGQPSDAAGAAGDGGMSRAALADMPQGPADAAAADLPAMQPGQVAVACLDASGSIIEQEGQRYRVLDSPEAAGRHAAQALAAGSGIAECVVYDDAGAVLERIAAAKP